MSGNMYRQLNDDSQSNVDRPMSLELAERIPLPAEPTACVDNCMGLSVAGRFRDGGRPAASSSLSSMHVLTILMGLFGLGYFPAKIRRVGYGHETTGCRRQRSQYKVLHVTDDLRAVGYIRVAECTPEC